MADESNPRNGYRVIEWFRFITPVLVTIAITMVGGLKSDIKDLDYKMFQHLTNDEVHTPRSTVVTRGEFQLSYDIREKQYMQIIKNIDDIRNLIIDRMK